MIVQVCLARLMQHQRHKIEGRSHCRTQLLTATLRGTITSETEALQAVTLFDAVGFRDQSGLADDTKRGNEDIQIVVDAA